MCVLAGQLIAFLNCLCTTFVQFRVICLISSAMPVLVCTHILFFPIFEYLLQLS